MTGLEWLQRGINMDHLFVPYRNPAEPWGKEQDDGVAARIREKEFDVVVTLGFRHVRLNLGRALLQEYAPPCRLREDGFRLLDRALDLAAARHLGAVIDMHQVPVPPLDSDPAQRKGFNELWSAIAKRYAPRRQPIAYELLNEPRVEDPKVWREIVTELIAAIRKADPKRPIIVTGGGWGGIGDLMALGAQKIPNLVYSFHFYDPFVFTHQGATWTGENVKPLRGIRYPIDPKQMKDLRAKSEADGKGSWPFAEVENGCGWDDLKARMRKALDWGKREGVPLYCGEFGTIQRDWTPAADRIAWIKDVRTVLDEAGCGWAMWAYHAGFDLVTKDDVPLPGIAGALGLTPK